jgi:hypothetical protein
MHVKVHCVYPVFGVLQKFCLIIVVAEVGGDMFLRNVS